MELYPFLFERNVHNALWGNERWLVSGHHSSPTVVANGEFKGKTLEELTLRYGRALTGRRSPSAVAFPLLFKVIDAGKRLSVQVHPNERTAPLTGGEPKTEMWCALRDGALIFAGLEEGAGPSDVKHAIETGKFEEITVRHEMSAGDVMFIPGGMVHAIAENSLIFEVQQSSNTTYRLYDWGRTGADGKPRKLHIAESLKTVDFHLPPPVKTREVDCAFFNFTQMHIEGEKAFASDLETFRVLFAAKGTMKVVSRSTSDLLAEGDAVLVPAGVSVTLVPEAAADVFCTTL